MALYHQVHEPLSRYCASLCGNSYDAKDLMNDSILIAFEKFEQTPIENFKAYLFGIASNCYYKGQRRNKFNGSATTEFLEAKVDLSQNPESQTDFELLKGYLQLLKAEQREVFVLHEINGFKLAEIAEIQNTSLSNVKQRAKRARDKLLLLLKEPSSTNENNHLKIIGL